MTPSGALTTLYSFCAETNCTDGACVYFGLVQGDDGNFYGTAGCGGAYATFPGDGGGTVFKITPDGTLTTLYSFPDYPNVYSPGALVKGAGGNFFGLAMLGGATNYGSIFQITPGGTLTTLHSGVLFGGLAQATNGILYGTDPGLGSDGEGSVFSLALGLGPFVETLPTSGEAGASFTSWATIWRTRPASPSTAPPLRSPWSQRPKSRLPCQSERPAAGSRSSHPRAR